MAFNVILRNVVKRSDTSVEVFYEWSNSEAATFQVQRSTNGTWGWTTVKQSTVTTNLAGKDNSWRDTGLALSGRYYWRVRLLVKGTVKATSSVFGPLYTRPAAPSSVAVTRPTPSQARVTGVKPDYVSTIAVFDGDTEVGSGSVLPITVASAPHEAHVYRLRAVGTGGTSAWSKTVKLAALAPPNAPILFHQTAMLRQGVAQTMFWWHMPADGSEMSATQMRWRAVGSSWTTLAPPTREASLPDLPVGVYEWQARTAGASGVYGPWAGIARFEVVDAPTVTILSPTDGVVVDSAVLTVNWVTYQAQGHPQTSWTVQLVNGSGVVLESRTGRAEQSVKLRTVLTHGQAYTVLVAIVAGVPGEAAAESDFTVSLASPAVPVAAVVWDDVRGCAVVHAAQGSGGATGTVKLQVERGEGDDWVLLDERVAGSPYAVDCFEAVSHGETVFRVTAWSQWNVPAAAVVTCAADSAAIWLSTGPRFGWCARLPFDPEVDIEAGRERSVQQYAGRTKPVAYAGKATSLVVKIGGSTFEADDDEVASVDDLIGIAQTEDAVHLLRTPRGDRVYGSLDGFQVSRDAPLWGYGFSITETDTQ